MTFFIKFTDVFSFLSRFYVFKRFLNFYLNVFTSMVSVCLLVPAMTDEPNEMPFGV